MHRHNQHLKTSHLHALRPENKKLTHDGFRAPKRNKRRAALRTPRERSTPTHNRLQIHLRSKK
ncbi:hypothetical protein Bca101_074876 [Brassica carinata]